MFIHVLQQTLLIQISLHKCIPATKLVCKKFDYLYVKGSNRTSKNIGDYK